MTSRTVVAVVVLLVLAALSFTLTQQRDEPVEPVAAALPDGYYLKNARLVATDQFGQQAYELRAKRIDERPASMSIELYELQLEYGNDENLWRLNARRGTMPSSNDRIDLDGGVRASLLNAAAHGATGFYSERLSVDMHTQSASTTDPATVEFAGGTLESLGLTVNMADETIALKSQVHGVFKPPSR